MNIFQRTVFINLIFIHRMFYKYMMEVLEMRIALLPLDSRPCNLDFPCKLACLAGTDIVTPPKQILDYFIQPANLHEIRAWLLDNAPSCDVLVISVDMLVYGGLLASRAGNDDEDCCRDRLDLVREIKSINPDLRIYAFSVIMRTSISTLSEESKVWWEKVNQYSRLSYKVEKEGDADDIRMLRQLVSEIPSHVLDTFLAARRRNHGINMECVDMAGQGYFDELLLLQEDSQALGMHKNEQELLNGRIAALGLGDMVFMHNGTDEAGCMLTARSIADNLGLKAKIGFKYLSDNRRDFTAMYEDRLFHENLLAHSKACSIELDEDLEENETVLFIYTPKERQYDACLYEGALPAGYTDQELEEFADEIALYMKKAKRVGLLDIVYSNGGDERLLKVLASRVDIESLGAYSAWNTASNALGTILAQMMLCTCGDRLKNAAFNVERILDDLVYQSIVRKRMEMALKGMGCDIWNLKEKKEEAEKMLSVYMHEESVLKELFKNDVPQFTCRLPWPRIFEADIQIV